MEGEKEEGEDVLFLTAFFQDEPLEGDAGTKACICPFTMMDGAASHQSSFFVSSLPPSLPPSLPLSLSCLAAGVLESHTVEGSDE